MVRTEGARFDLAHAAARESHTTSALAAERLILERQRSQDDPSSCRHQRSRTESHREALDNQAQNNREAQHGQAEDRKARHRETGDHKARSPQGHNAPSHRWALDREAPDAPQFLDPQEAPLGRKALTNERARRWRALSGCV